jgi:hypothetical protein
MVGSFSHISMAGHSIFVSIGNTYLIVCGGKHGVDQDQAGLRAALAE